METRNMVKAILVSAALLGVLFTTAMVSDLESAKAANQFFTMPLGKTSMPQSAVAPLNLPQSGQSVVLVPQMPGLEVELVPAPAAPSRPAAWQHKFDAHLLIVGRTEKNDDRLRQPGEGTREGGVTVLRPASPRA